MEQGLVAPEVRAHFESVYGDGIKLGDIVWEHAITMTHARLERISDGRYR